MTRAYIGLGGNVGNPRATMAAAIRKLDDGGARLVARSSDYETPPWGKTDQPAFFNACIAVETSLSAHALLQLCLATEEGLGRRRIEKWGPRTIDIDIIAFGQEVHDEPDLKTPHPYALERAFVLVPLAEIAPDLELSGQRISEALKGLDVGAVKRLPPETAP